MIEQRETRLETLPLQGKRIAVTRPERQAQSLMQGLQRLGAEPLGCPTIRIEGSPDSTDLQRAIDRLEGYDWLVFTSANGVRWFWRALEQRDAGDDPIHDMRVAAIGPATARALRGRGIEAELVPDEYVAEAVADALVSTGSLEGARVLLPRAAGARPILPKQLESAGATVDEVVSYVSRSDESGIARLREAIEDREVDMITFTASSTVRHFVEAAGTDIGEARVAVIGPITAGTARDLGLEVHVVASEYTVPGLLRAIAEYYEAQRGGTS